ncbi:signal peptidase II [Corynebacterium kozikiae]|uniref:signal peptidase II n=1 Tax=Corynebacterium kozikiae TaxID=2968469 RepID=UPI00211C7152|nr:signal peptidase II [Corynebacterium sp. 76QC2CO]
MNRSFSVVAAMIVVLAAVDQASKAIALRVLADGQAREFIGSLLQFRLTFNPGAAFSFGEGSTWLFTTIQLVAVVAALWFSRKVSYTPQVVALGMIAGGAAGNLIDRLVREPGFYHGHVVDFLWLRGFAIFNIADIAITCGVALFVVSDFLKERKQKGEVRHA